MRRDDAGVVATESRLQLGAADTRLVLDRVYDAVERVVGSKLPERLDLLQLEQVHEFFDGAKSAVPSRCALSSVTTAICTGKLTPLADAWHVLSIAR